jgi:hypothetical protein
LFLLVGGWKYTTAGLAGVQAAAAAAGICWLGAELALVVTLVVRFLPKKTPGLVVGSVLGAMVFRAVLPFAGGMALARVPVLAAGGVFGCVLLIYLGTLVAETILSVPSEKRNAALAGPAAPVAPANGITGA